MQFPLDIANGRLACDRGEHVKLRHLAHSLKSVLLTLGHTEAAEVARQLELDAEQAATGSEDALAAARAAWPVLEGAIGRLL
jgi:HPt (histidine-containing phosphotransfer) domain-containing protein